jgi:predicted acylesterase/phospholipase RssA
MSVIGRRTMAVGCSPSSCWAAAASAHVIHGEARDPEVPCLRPLSESNLLLGVALSGGGSRAAIFGSAGLEALAGLRLPDGTSLIEKISHLSSVSGGSIAASYYALKKPGKDVAVLKPDGTLSDAYRAFFDQYRADLSQDFENALIWNQLLSFRWINSALAAQSLAEILRDRLFAKTTFGEISQRERNGDTPGLIVNSTLYNNGRRFAMAVVPPGDFDYDFFADLRKSLERQGREMEPAPFIERRWQLLKPITPLELHMDPCVVSLAGAVTASASFPPLVGPITLQVGGEKVYWHAGDGGLYENQGVETLLLLYLKQLQAKRAKRSLIIAFDSSFPFSVGERRLSLRSLPFSLWTFDFSRIPSIMEERASTYQALFFRTLQLEGVIPDSKTVGFVALRHTDAKWAADASDVPDACKAELKPMKSAQDVVERIAEIPTRLNLPSECDKQLLVEAARRLVAEHADEILRFINRP